MNFRIIIPIIHLIIWLATRKSNFMDRLSWIVKGLTLEKLNSTRFCPSMVRKVSWDFLFAERAWRTRLGWKCKIRSYSIHSFIWEDKILCHLRGGNLIFPLTRSPWTKEPSKARDKQRQTRGGIAKPRMGIAQTPQTNTGATTTRQRKGRLYCKKFQNGGEDQRRSPSRTSWPFPARLPWLSVLSLAPLWVSREISLFDFLLALDRANFAVRT